ncbi:uncharacterized protein FIESC28_05545 [Fusarium coffeatum]|uniref:Uncharacterized protein n=1 Tax=Fusarium coffeatum TaxID=231269 RepID=A0A366RT27_9HYPO|nr:uncharacterized protein FIESC28_05545 [Fusarium coffeatum]RBR19550.1 hypothetical protein FIESC28_05545 [Fusarium coffeatum]
MRAVTPFCIVALAANLTVASVCKPRPATSSTLESAISTTSTLLSTLSTATVEAETEASTTSVVGTISSIISEESTSTEAIETLETTVTANPTTTVESASTDVSSISTTVETTTTTDSTTTLESSIADITTAAATTTSEAVKPIPTFDIIASGGAVDGKVLTGKARFGYFNGFDMQINKDHLTYSIDTISGFVEETSSGARLCIMNGARSDSYRILNCPPNIDSMFYPVSFITCQKSSEGKLNCQAPLRECTGDFDSDCTAIDETLGPFYYGDDDYGKYLNMGLSGGPSPGVNLHAIELIAREIITES